MARSGPAKRLENLPDHGRKRDRRCREIIAAVGKHGGELRQVLPRTRRRPRRREGTASRDEDVAGRQRRAGIDQQDDALGQWRRPCQAFADARHEGGAPGKTHRHIGAKLRGEIEQLLFGHRHPPELDKLTQRRSGIGRAAAQPGCDGYMFDEADRGARRHARPVGQQACRLEHQVVGLSSQCPGQRPVEAEREAVVRPRLDLIGQIDESHEGVEQMVAVVAAADDVQPEIDLGMRRPHQIDPVFDPGAAQPPCLASAGFS